MKTVILKFIAMSFLIAFLGSGLEASEINVGIGVNLSFGELSSSSTMTMTDKKGARISGKNLKFSVSGKSVIVSGKAFTPPLQIRSSSPIVYNKRPYLGFFKVTLSRGRLFVVNVIDVESYLRGVLKMEVNPGWPKESLKAQAIISRTYALNQMGRHGSDGFDVCATQHCQVYRGINAHDRAIDKAISETKGKVLTYKGSLAKTLFHSDSGGITAAAKDVWGGDLPYLVSVSDPVSSSSPHSKWTASLTGSQIGTALARIGQNIGTATSISVLSRDGSGRVLDMEVLGTSGRIKIRAHKFREALGGSLVKSTSFTLRGSASLPTSEPLKPAPNRPNLSDILSPAEERLLMMLTKQGAFSSDELIAMLMDPSKKRYFIQKAQGKAPLQPQTPVIAERKPASGGGFILEGKGWGHGVGLSQWGAMALASSGWSAERILAHYYPGTSIAIRK
ncbi:SpoIID/LytB domain-containing protein [Dethiosulfovibrio salsuginis]|uniref:Stage II sporulation protein D n=1 Tax=Dethiosulfovibrio salsuginis TaxID=561720 RepID=A0A1X7I3Y9_9BACT|nr:SpoIID/LytB domain-containing protein [Dethiosulfovibrio salsuginis]SMG08897.1 stage II sporulation protein D [Dethiosulfovibrio salsuginis]